MNKTEQAQKDALFTYVKDYVKSKQIRCAEDCWQSDHLIEDAPAFLEECSTIVGFHDDGKLKERHDLDA